MNNDFTKILLEQFGDQVAGKLSSRTELSRKQSLDALESLSPVVLGELKRKQESVGRSGMEELLAEAGFSENTPDEMDDIFERGLAGEKSPIEDIFDQKTQDSTSEAFSKKFNIGGGIARKLLPILAPIIIGMLFKQGRGATTSNQRTPSGSSSGLGGGIGAILDRDGDGSVIDDIAGMILGGGGSHGQQRRSGSGLMRIISMILSFLFRRK